MIDKRPNMARVDVQKRYAERRVCPIEKSQGQLPEPVGDLTSEKESLNGRCEVFAAVRM